MILKMLKIVIINGQSTVHMNFRFWLILNVEFIGIKEEKHIFYESQKSLKRNPYVWEVWWPGG